MRQLWLFLFLLLVGISSPAKNTVRPGESHICSTALENQEGLSTDEPLTPVVIEAGDFQHSRCLSQQRHFNTTTAALPEIFHPQVFVTVSFAQRQSFPLRKHLLYCILRC